MKIAKVCVKNYRSIYEETLECDNLTILVGSNGSGKSSFLQALRLFMDTTTSPTNEDYYNNDTSKQICIEITFSGLSDEEKNEFRSYLDGEQFVVQRRFPQGEYYGRIYGCLELDPLREQLRKGLKVRDAIPKLEELVDSGKFPGLNKVKTNIQDELDRWENDKENSSRCQHYFRGGMFQGPPNIAGGKLKNRTHFVYIPPVREAELDASGSNKQSPLGVLIAPLLAAITEQNTEIKDVRTAITTSFSKYRSLVENAPEKGMLENKLTQVLQRYDAEAAATVRLVFDGDLNLPSPKPKVRLLEDGFEGEVSKKGHGLQRLFIFSILELYELYKNRANEGPNQDGVALIIEEPELYQHPSRIRALSRTMQYLCDSSKPDGLSFQIFCSTHSPYFVSLDKFPAIRKVEKVERSSGPMESKIASASLQSVGDTVLKALQKKEKATDKSTWARLRQILGIKGSEGFFADAIILVEGIEDVAIILAMFSYKKIFLDQYGIAVISSEGKTSLPMLLALYEELHIPTYTIFDGDFNKPDKDAKRIYNEALLELFGETRDSKPSTKVMTNGCVWQNNFIEEIKALYSPTSWDEYYRMACDEYDMNSDEGKKKYVVNLEAMKQLLTKYGVHKKLEELSAAIISKFRIKIP